MTTVFMCRHRHASTIFDWSEVQQFAFSLLQKSEKVTATFSLHGNLLPVFIFIFLFYFIEENYSALPV